MKCLICLHVDSAWQVNIILTLCYNTNIILCSAMRDSCKVILLLAVMYGEGCGTGPAAQPLPVMRVRTKVNPEGKVEVIERKLLSPRPGVSQSIPVRQRARSIRPSRLRPSGLLHTASYGYSFSHNLPPRHSVRLPDITVDEIVSTLARQ